jgi:P27 family predicted phage terminase small subunit
MSRGGARTGSGRKPTRPMVFRRLAGMPGREPDSGVSTMPPEDLPADQRDFWQRYAGLAVEKRTLTVHTVAAFRLLCELDAEKQQIKATIDQDGRTFLKVTVDGAGVEHQELKAHPLTTAYGRTAKAVEALMARFGLAPFGKAEQPLARKAAVNPWAAQATQP